MKYYLIVGEASGDLHASHLMQSLKAQDPHADFRFFGGDLMAAVGGTRVKHFRELAYMGFIPVLLHLRTIFKNMDLCKKDILQWQPDVVILVDYPGFNLSIAKFVHNLKPETLRPQVFYYISPKIWAWKEYRIKNIKRDVDELFSILPFEVDFFEKKHHYPIHYVGNPTAQEVREFIDNSENSDNSDYSEYSEKPIIALLAGSRQQEIKDNLPAMIEATGHLTSQYDIILAGAPGIERSYYEKFIQGTSVKLMENQTFVLLSKATAALVTSGTATLETALFRVPQIVCYETPIPTVIAFLRKLILKVKYISLVNLIADKEVVPELVADTFSVENIRTHLGKILPEGSQRQAMLEGYDEVIRRLGDSRAHDVAEQQIYELLNNNQNN